MVSLALMVKKIFTKNHSGYTTFYQTLAARPSQCETCILMCSHAYMYFKKKVSHILQKVLDLFR